MTIDKFQKFIDKNHDGSVVKFLLEKIGSETGQAEIVIEGVTVIIKRYTYGTMGITKILKRSKSVAIWASGNKIYERNLISK